MAKKTPHKKKGSAKYWVLALLFFVLLPLSFSYVIVILSCLIPSFVAFLTDKDSEKRSAICISSLNAAGTFPILIQLFEIGPSIDNAMFILAAPHTWFVVLGSSLIGLFFFSYVPVIVATLSKYHDEAQILKLQESKELLEARWGKELN
ncbi:MAG: hypothetical protein FWF23_03015 [Alphaproteobacteria bacterium]|nr:hypothetical protein [Alphaproteobacteria bacterium]MCL2504899.1 hypothetical protein [Alphaproteobacteria bacterium]